MHYTEQIRWILFLKFLDDYEARESYNARLNGESYAPILEEKFRFGNWIKMPWWEDVKDFDLSAKNPNKNTEEILRKPEEIVQEIAENNEKITVLLSELREIL